MDLLSDVVASMRSGSPGAARVEWYGNQGWWLPGDPGVAGFLAVLSGTCWMFPEEGGAPVALGPGDVVLSPYGGGYGLADSPVPPEEVLEEARPSTGEGLERYVYGNPGAPAGPPSTVLVCGGYRLDRERSHPLLSALPNHVHLRADRRDAALDRVLAGLGEESAAARPGADALVPLLLDSLLLYVLRACLDEAGEAVGSVAGERTGGRKGIRDRESAENPRGVGSRALGGWARALTDPGVGAALSAVHGDPARPWTVAGLATVARMSRATFARRFTALAGQPPMAYVTWWRLNSARGLLRDTDLPVDAVAARVGYGSPFAFSHAFRLAYGTPPGRYRRASRASRAGRGGPTPR